MKRFFKSLYIGRRWFLVLASVVVVFFCAFFLPFLWWVAMVILSLFVAISIIDILLLYATKNGISARRLTSERWHLGEDNVVCLTIENEYAFSANVEIIDEVPVQFQRRNFLLQQQVPSKSMHELPYSLRPLSRGMYAFGNLNIYVSSPICFFQRKFVLSIPETVKVYPSSKYLRNYQLLAIHDKNNLLGTKKIRRLGNSLEFEQIKEYVMGDDMRSVNWHATARHNNLMVNTYTDSRAQLIYCVIDKGRTMKMPFQRMTLLDYAINASLVFLNIALLKHDKAGLITFSSLVDDILPADNNVMQMNRIRETLYHQQTEFLDADFEKLHTVTRYKLSQRSFLMLFTNFESLVSLERQMPYLKGLSKRHLLCVVFFENTAIHAIHNNQPDTIEGIYIKTIADRFDFEKKQMVKELRRHGIIAILTTPEKLTIDIINNYLELKSRQFL